MLDIVINLLTFVLIIVSLFMLLVILLQRANSNAGMGSAFGGGVTESTFGAETTNILVKATKWSALAFFIIALILYLLFMSRESAASKPMDTDLPDIPVVEASEPTAEQLPVLEDSSQEVLDTAVAEAQQILDTATTEAVDAAEVLAEEPVPVTLPEPETVPAP